MAVLLGRDWPELVITAGELQSGLCRETTDYRRKGRLSSSQKVTEYCKYVRYPTRKHDVPSCIFFHIADNYLIHLQLAL